ncbi:hypothetical protein ACIQI7_38635 [Kitasatospora sp. NPDC092039]|uniref:hypothetical protein n=1 Tax=Kitasatospora sp. NPDC092039 TaxID=3364086 RepID=UPI0038069721
MLTVPISGSRAGAEGAAAGRLDVLLVVVDDVQLLDGGRGFDGESAGAGRSKLDGLVLVVGDVAAVQRAAVRGAHPRTVPAVT